MAWSDIKEDAKKWVMDNKVASGVGITAFGCAVASMSKLWHTEDHVDAVLLQTQANIIY